MTTQLTGVKVLLWLESIQSTIYDHFGSSNVVLSRVQLRRLVVTEEITRAKLVEQPNILSRCGVIGSRGGLAKVERQYGNILIEVG